MPGLIENLDALAKQVRAEDDALAATQRVLEEKRRELASAMAELKTLTDVVRDKGIDPDIPLDQYIETVRTGVAECNRYRTESEDYLAGRKKPDAEAGAAPAPAVAVAEKAPATAKPAAAHSHDDLFGGGIA